MKSSRKEFVNVKLLLGRGTPRDYIPSVIENNAKLPCDRLLVKFYPEYFAYKIMRNYFLRHEEYTHLVLATDDIVVKANHICQLAKDLEESYYPVLSGLMNVDLDDHVFVNLSMSLPMKNRRLRKYSWLSRDEVFVKDNIFQVAFSGFPLMAICRDVVKLLSFDADKVFEGLPPHRGASLDFVFCWYCQERDIPIMVDKRIDLLHLRTAGGLEVNKQAKKIVFQSPGAADKTIVDDYLR